MWAMPRLPEHFCWTRFGTEAGQLVAQILDRKEKERQASQGIFLWGIGNAVGAGITELVRCCSEPEVLFSPIKSAPRAVDVTPESVVAWTAGETLDGDVYSLPDSSLVTSRLPPGSVRPSHYALVCFSGQPIELSVDVPVLAFDGLRNLLSGRRLGASQVTAVVTRETASPQTEAKYAVAFRAHLVYPYFIRLRGPVPVRNELRSNAFTILPSQEPLAGEVQVRQTPRVLRSSVSC